MLVSYMVLTRSSGPPAVLGAYVEVVGMESQQQI